VPLEPNSRQAIAVKRAKGTLGTFLVSGLLESWVPVNDISRVSSSTLTVRSMPLSCRVLASI
jgi:hypothetical protein